MTPQFRPWLHIPFTNLWIGKLENAMLFTLMVKRFRPNSDMYACQYTLEAI